MPAARFWEFEDAQVDFGSVDAGPTDLVRMLLVEFALAYGNDWFVIPIELDVGSLYRTRSLVITDTFGVRTLIKSSSELDAPHSVWRMFQHSYTRGSGFTVPASNLFFLPPSLLKSLESRPIEEVLFLRDEMANLAWAVERLIESPAERPLNRFEAYLEQKRRRELRHRRQGFIGSRTAALSSFDGNPRLLDSADAGADGARASSEAWRRAQDGRFARTGSCNRTNFDP